MVRKAFRTSTGLQHVNTVADLIFHLLVILLFIILMISGHLYEDDLSERMGLDWILLAYLIIRIIDDIICLTRNRKKDKDEQTSVGHE